MFGAVGEEPVDDHAADGEEEDDEAPGELVQGRAVGLEDLNCKGRDISGCRETEGTAGEAH